MSRVTSKRVSDPLEHDIKVSLLLGLKGFLNLDEAGMLDAGVFLYLHSELGVLVLFEPSPKLD